MLIKMQQTNTFNSFRSITVWWMHPFVYNITNVKCNEQILYF